MRAIDADRMKEELLWGNVFLSAKETNALVDLIDNQPTLTQPNEPTHPCDLCVYNPPSSLDGKPCTFCPATGRPLEGEEEKP